MGQTKPEGKRPGRPHVIPPPPPPVGWRRELDALKSLGGSVKVVLWRALRRTHLWADTPPERRKGLFNPPSEAMLQASGRVCMREPELIEPVGVFTSLLRAPHETDGRLIGGACRRVHEWADARGMLAVAVQFAEAAATVQPESAARANDAARLCRRAAYDDRAADWYLRAYKLGVRGKGRGNRKQSLWALLGYGALMKDLGRHEEAKLYYNRAARAAYSMGLRKAAAEAQHDLMGLAAEMGEFTAAEWHARQALRLYPDSHPRLPALAHDWAFVLVRLHCYTPAIPLLQEAVRRTYTLDLQTLFWGTLARAVAGARQRSAFDEAEAKILHLTELNDEYAPAALIHLAEGERSFGEWEQANHYACRTLEIAQRRRDTLLEKDAAELLAAIADRLEAPIEQPVKDQERTEVLTRRFKAKLQRWKAPDCHQPGADPDSNGSSSSGEAA